jgi:hypothetical protein
MIHKPSPFRALLLVITAVFIGLIYSVPQLMHWAQGGAGAFLLGPEEAPYPPLLVILARFALSSAGFLIFFSALWQVGFKTSIAYLVAFWFYLELDPTAYLPLSGLIGGINALTFNRFPMPLLSLLLFFLAFNAGARGIYAQESRRALFWGMGGGLISSFLFVCSVQSWAHLVIGICLAALAVRNRHRWRFLGAWLVATAIVSVPSLDILKELLFHRDATALSHLVAELRLWAMTIAATAILYFRQAKASYLLGFIVAGIACYYVSLISGRMGQDIAWHYTLAPMIMAGAAWGVDYTLRLALRNDYFRLIPSLSGVFLVLIASTAIKAGQNSYARLAANQAALKMYPAR